eukprot:Skav206381  [mRNA]  locus=scaffold834:438367:443528:- [translate_table: standard]
MPQLDQGHFLFDIQQPFSQTPSPDCLASVFESPHDRPQPAWEIFNLSVATANVLTLYPRSWHALPTRLFNRLSAAVTAWQRQIAGVGYWSADRVTDEAFQGQFELASLRVRLHKHQLLYAFQIAEASPDFLVSLLLEEDRTVDSSWLSALLEAVHWWTSLDDLPDLVQLAALDKPHRGPQLWDWFRDHRHQGPAMVRRAYQRSLLQTSIAVHLRSSLQRIVHKCSAAGIEMTFPTQSTLEEAAVPSDRFRCQQCQVDFASLQAWQAHQWRMHGLMSLERRYGYDATCAACQKCLWTSQRLQIHLRGTRQQEDGCLAYLVKHFEPLDSPQQADLPAHLRGLHRLPAVQVPGPILPRRPRHYPPATHCVEWREQWLAASSPPFLDMVTARTELDAALFLRPPPDAEEEIALVILETVDRHFHQDAERGFWALALWGYSHDFHCGPQDLPPLQRSVQRVFLEVVSATPMWPLLLAGATIPGAVPLLGQLDTFSRTRGPPRKLVVPDTALYTDIPKMVARILPTSMGSWPQDLPVPLLRLPSGETVVLILHMFSGRRRVRDAHWWMEHYGEALLQGMKVVGIAMDTAVHFQDGNLLEGAGHRGLSAFIAAGAIAGSLGGPPCETWSQARHNIVENRRGPIPLRSSERPWGLEGLSGRNLRQLAVGNRLMLTNLENEVSVVLAGGGSVMEHPGVPTDATRASIWTTSVHEMIMSAPAAHQAHIDQCDYGAMSRKPTTLRGLQVGGLADGLVAWKQLGRQQPSTIHHVGRVGRALWHMAHSQGEGISRCPEPRPHFLSPRLHRRTHAPKRSANC